MNIGHKPALVYNNKDWEKKKTYMAKLTYTYIICL